MQEVHVIVSRDGDRYMAEVPGILSGFVRADSLDELEHTLTKQLHDLDEFKNASFSIVRKSVREPMARQTENEDEGIRWLLWKQDNRGGRFQISSHETACLAERECAKLKSQKDGQFYWVEPERVEVGADDSNDIWEFED